MTDFDLRPHVEPITALVRTASDRSLEMFRRPRTELVIENKLERAAGDRFDPVTAVDRSVEREIRSALSEWFPDHAILGEEDGTTGAGRYRWVIDPIDGTRAFVSGQPMWGTLVGLQDGARPVAGWMHVPTLGETYVATVEGAEHRDRRGRRPLATSQVVSLSEATMLCTHPSMFETPEEIHAFSSVASACRLTRYSGDCVNYGLLASGDADLVVENQLQPYDIIPLIPLVEQSGGVVTDLDGGPATDGGWAVAAATEELHAAALDLLNS